MMNRKRKQKYFQYLSEKEEQMTQFRGMKYKSGGLLFVRIPERWNCNGLEEYLSKEKEIKIGKKR